MRKKELKVVAAFHTTADAMAAEQVCAVHGVPGRLIPVPRTLSAGCGIAWCSPIEERERLVGALEADDVEYEQIAEVAV